MPTCRTDGRRRRSPPCSSTVTSASRCTRRPRRRSPPHPGRRWPAADRPEAPPRYLQMEEDSRRVLDELTPVEREVRTREGVFLARGLPYRSGEDPDRRRRLHVPRITARKATEKRCANRRPVPHHRQPGRRPSSTSTARPADAGNHRFCEIADCRRRPCSEPASSTWSTPTIASATRRRSSGSSTTASRSTWKSAISGATARPSS